MRISDWSSDVCSSDLPDRESTPPYPPGRAVLRRAASEGWRPRSAARPASAHAAIRPRRRPEIGRASCRERVCQYVSISVVDVSLKKKTIKKQLVVETN